MDSQSKALAIQELRNKPVVFSNEELATLFRAANPRMKLYMLLMLNCGMTQKDVSDLDVREVDWDEGRIIRKRSKTRGNGNVPEVDYRLWPETWDLLLRESSRTEGGPILLNRNGRTLCSEEYVDGKYKKRDGIKDAFNRITTKAGIRKSLTSLKKTSASLLRTSDKYNSVRSLFLGHAEPRLADQHYAKAPQVLLDEAIAWVREELEIDKLDLTGG
jgi:integrase